MYLRFSPVTANGLDHWDVLHPSAPIKPIARVTLNQEGHCSLTVTSDRALSPGEIATLNMFMKAHEREA